MNCFNQAYIWPHGFSLVPEVAGPEREVFSSFYETLENMGKEICKGDPSVIFIITPHGVRVEGEILIYITEYLEGHLNQFGEDLYLKTQYGKEIAEKVYTKLKSKKFPIKKMIYGTSSGRFSVAPMDWATFIPLWWIKKAYGDREMPKIVVLSVDGSNLFHYDKYIEFGKMIRESFDETEENGVWISSADQGHCHSEDSFYGFNSASIYFDEAMCEMAKTFSFDQLLSLDCERIKEAKTDSIIQTLMLYGAFKDKKCEPKYMYYKAPTYFGMMAAGYIFDKNK